MIFADRRSYNQLLAGDEGIATNILADRLKKLVAAGLLTRSPDPAHSRRATYSLTESAIRLVPTLVHLGFWGQEWLPASAELRERSRQLFSGGPAHWAELMDRLRAGHLAGRAAENVAAPDGAA
jgi:DNA-binding HxlR family transcriptional regulator